MKYVAIILLNFLGLSLYAQSGYEIKITLKPFKNQYVYLGHYYGRQLPIIDSVKLNEKSEGTFRGPKKLGGGVYLIGYPDRSHSFDLLIDKNQRFSILADTNHIQTLGFQNSPENTEFKAYQETMAREGMAVDALVQKQKGTSVDDSLKISRQIEALNAKIKKYRSEIIAREPNGLLTTLLKAMKE